MLKAEKLGVSSARDKMRDQIIDDEKECAKDSQSGQDSGGEKYKVDCRSVQR